MKISMIIETSNPQSNGKLIAAELQRQGHSVQILDGNSHIEHLVSQIKQFIPQVLFGTHLVRSLSGEDILRIKSQFNQLLCVEWYVDGYGPNHSVDKENFERNRGVFDLMFVAVKGLIPEIKLFAKSVIFFPQYYDDVFFKPTIEKQDTYDVSFLGNLYPLSEKIRLEFINELKKRYKVLVGGGGLGPLYYGVNCADFYMRSKISIELPKGLPAKEMLFSDRIYRAIGLGCLFLTLDNLGIEQMFTPKVHLDVYDGTINSLCEKIDYYLSHPQELERIAKTGQKEVLEKHTIGVRVRQYIAEIEKML